MIRVDGLFGPAGRRTEDASLAVLAGDDHFSRIVLPVRYKKALIIYLLKLKIYKNPHGEEGYGKG